jgi:hypothetical protein
MRLKSKVKIVLLTTLISNLTVINNSYAANCSPEITTNGSRTVVAFKTVGTCTWSTPAGATNFKGLIVAGGGGGGSAMGGGGGGGGYVEFETLTATSDVFTVTVGDGGAAGTSNTTGPAAISGGNSSISGSGISLIARGGAGGASNYAGGFPAQLNGGSGGGAAGSSSYDSVRSSGSQTVQSQIPTLSAIGGNQFGFDGSIAGANWFPGGGGGAGGNGANTPANGGSGRANSILGTTYLWAGGGGGSGYTSIGGAGGTGGGGAGGTWNTTSASAGTGGLNSSGNAVNNGSAGATNTGGGGGGGSYTYLGAKGGSGIIVLSYLTFIGNTTISLQLTSGFTSAIYRATSTIEALVGTAGKVTFYQAGKVIPGCKNRNSSGAAPNIKATCTWKPSTRGNVQITAQINPISASYALTRSSTFAISVGQRTTPR